MFRRQNLTLLTLVFKGLDVPTKELMHGSNLDAIPAPPMTHVVTAVTESATFTIEPRMLLLSSFPCNSEYNSSEVQEGLKKSLTAVHESL